MDWQGDRSDPASGRPAAHPNARFTVPASQCHSIAREWDAPEGLPISALVFGGRRAAAVPFVTEAFTWQHGVYLAANISSEGTAAAETALGALRHDPFAMLPFCGYHMTSYLEHWLRLGAAADSDAVQLPRIYLVNWFRKGSDGRYLWPGFGDNVRVLKWIVDRCEGRADAVASPIGYHPAAGQLDLDDLRLDATAQRELLAVDVATWRREAAANRNALTKLGEVPAALIEEQLALEERLAGPSA